MKKLFVIALSFLMIACSSNEDSNNSNQTFFEKYNGVVWQSVEIGVFRLQWNNGSKITVSTYALDGGEEFCDSWEMSNIGLSNVSENSFNYTGNDGGDSEEEYSSIVTVTENGNLEIYSSEENDKEVYTRASLTNPCD